MMFRKTVAGWLFGLIPLLVWDGGARAETAARPNVLWFVVDDMSAQFSCYGETVIETPHVDRLAREGVRFTAAHVTAPVCSTCRSSFLTGCYQSRLGVHHHRSSRDQAKIRLPEFIVPLPVLFQRAGYYTCNGSGLAPSAGIKQRKKTDYNFAWNQTMYDGADWAAREPGQPFFMQVQLAGGKLRGADEVSFRKVAERSAQAFGAAVKLDDVRLPPHYPDDPILRKDWAAYLDSVRLTDRHVGQVIERLRHEGLWDNTLIVFMTDHGISHARGKQFLYREGTHVPFVVRGPGVEAGGVRDDLIEHIDMAALSLSVAGIPLPAAMDGRDILNPNYRPRKYVFGARDRCDETVDFIRSVRSQDFLYIRNYQPFRPHLQPSRYKDGKLIVKRLRALNQSGKLDPQRVDLLFRPQRPGEELYALAEDPHEMQNLAGQARWADELNRMRSALDEHLRQSRDVGFVPEPMLADIVLRSERTIYEFAQSEGRYPLDEILPLANLAIRRDPSQLARFCEALQHSDPVMRYWGLMGLRVLEDGGRDAEALVRKRLSDDEPSVRVAAAMVLGGLGLWEVAAESLLTEAQAAETDALALSALDGIKYLDRPAIVAGIEKASVVRGEYSGRSYQFLLDGGKVFQ